MMLFVIYSNVRIKYKEVKNLNKKTTTHTGSSKVVKKNNSVVKPSVTSRPAKPVTPKK